MNSDNCFISRFSPTENKKNKRYCPECRFKETKRSSREKTADNNEEFDRSGYKQAIKKE
jgi:hypothetical protein